MSNLTALGVHIYAGGFTVGVSKHFEPLGHLEEGKIGYGTPSAKLNFPHLPMISGVENWKPFIQDLRSRRGVPDLVYSNPPCAAFSIAGATMRGGGNAWRTDPRLSCWENCFSVLEELRPTMYVVESVVRAFTAGREFVDTFVERAAKMGYAATHTLVDAQYLGLPQVRKRYFLVLHKVGFELPAPNWAPPKTAAEALSEVSDPGYFEPIKDPIQKEMVPGLKQGQAMRPLWEKRMLEEVGPPETWPRSANGVKGRPRLFLHRIKGDKPIGTITGAYMIKHDEDRMLGMKELAYLNGYPEDYKFENHPRYHPSLIARGVSPTVASYLAAGLRQSIENGKPIKTGEVNLIDYREPPKGVVY